MALVRVVVSEEHLSALLQDLADFQFPVDIALDIDSNAKAVPKLTWQPFADLGTNVLQFTSANAKCSQCGKEASEDNLVRKMLDANGGVAYFCRQCFDAK
jgi:hypothetical protein